MQTAEDFLSQYQPQQTAEDFLSAYNPPASTNDNINTDYDKRLQQAGDIVSGFESGKLNPVGAALGTASTGLGLIKDVGGDIIKGTWNDLPNAVTAPVESGASFLKNQFMQTPEGVAIQAASPIIKQQYNQFAANNPNIAQGLNLFGNVAATAPVAKGIEGFGKLVGDLPETGGSFSIGKPALNYDPAATHAAISQSYGQALQGANAAYNWMRTTASGKTIDASSMVQPVKDMISDIESDPFHEARTSLPKLKNFVAQTEENPNIPLSDVVDMKQDINSNFNPKRFTQGAKTPYFQVGQMLDTKLSDAAERYPIFGSAKKLADQTWVNTVAQPFTENSVLQKFWKPEDYYAQKSVASGMANQLPDATQQRAITMLGNVSNPIELNAVTRALPPDMAETFKRAKYNDITNGGGATRLQSAGKTFASVANLAPLDVAKNALHTIVGKEYTPAEKELMAATKTSSPSLGLDTYQAQLGAAKASAPPNLPLAITYQPQTPTPEWIIGRDGIRRATPEELATNEAGRQARAKMGIYPAQGVPTGENIAPAQAASTKGGSKMLQQYGSAKLLGNENIPPISEGATQPGALGNAEYIKQQKLDANQKISDLKEGFNALQGMNQLKPEDVQAALENLQSLEKITGNSPRNTAIRDEFMKAFNAGRKKK